MRVLLVEPSARGSAPDPAREALEGALEARGHDVRRLALEPADPASPRAFDCARARAALAGALAAGGVDAVVLVDPERLPAALAAAAVGRDRRVLAASLGGPDAPATPPAAPRPLAVPRGAPPAPAERAPHPDVRGAVSRAYAGPPLAPEALVAALGDSANGGSANGDSANGAPHPGPALDDDFVAALARAWSDHLRVAAWAEDLAGHAVDVAAGPSLGGALRGLGRRARRILRKLR